MLSPPYRGVKHPGIIVPAAPGIIPPIEDIPGDSPRSLASLAAGTPPRPARLSIGTSVLSDAVVRAALSAFRVPAPSGKARFVPKRETSAVLRAPPQSPADAYPARRYIARARTLSAAWSTMGAG